MVRVCRVVDNVELPLLVVVAVPPVHHAVLVSRLVSELPVVAEEETTLEQLHCCLTPRTSSQETL